MKNEPGRNDPCPCGSGKKYKRCCYGRYSSSPLVATTAMNAERPGIFPNSSVTAREGIGYIGNSPAMAPATKNGLAWDSPTVERPRDEWEKWYDDYAAKDLSGKLDMLGALLAQDRPAEFYEDLDWVGIVLDLELQLDQSTRETYIAFLEDMADARPEVFKLGATYFVHAMTYMYMNSGREAKIASVLKLLSVEDGDLEGPLFDLLDLLRLGGRYEECRSLSLTCIGKIGSSDLMPWAVSELTETASFFILDEFIRKGNPAGEFEALRGELARIQFTPDDAVLRQIISYRSGTTEHAFTLEDVRGKEAAADTNRYLLGLEFGRWLCKDRRIPAVASEALRAFVYESMVEMNGNLNCNPFTLREDRLTDYLRKFFSFLSLQRLRGIGTVIGLRHFYDFLLSANLIKATQHRQANRVLDKVGSGIEAAINQSGSSYGFLRHSNITTQT